jgi:hypothetical protein
MKSFLQVIWTVFLLQASSAISQTCNTAAVTQDPNCCLKDSGITTFSNCNYMSDTINSCFGPSVSAGAPFISCFCNQALFNAIFGCVNQEDEKEERITNQLTDMHYTAAPAKNDSASETQT